MQNEWINRIDSHTIKRDQLGWLDTSIVPLESYFACIAFRCVAFSKGKEVLLKILRKVSFLLWGGQSASSWGLLNIWGFWQSFSRKILFGRTVHGSSADGPKLTSNHTEQCADRVDRVDGLWATDGQSARPSWTVRPAQRATLTVIDFTFLPLNSNADSPWGHRGQSARYMFLT
jgi:hypothetical protein